MCWDDFIGESERENVYHGRFDDVLFGRLGSPPVERLVGPRPILTFLMALSGQSRWILLLLYRPLAARTSTSRLLWYVSVAAPQRTLCLLQMFPPSKPPRFS